jgi:hypothetical protein
MEVMSRMEDRLTSPLNQACGPPLSGEGFSR